MTHRRPSPALLPRPVTVTVTVMENPTQCRAQRQDIAEAWATYQPTQSAQQGAEQAKKTA